MWVLLGVCLLLHGAASSLRCPDGLECKEPSTCCRRPGEDGYACCDQPQFSGTSLRMLPPNTLKEEPGVACPDGRMCPSEYSCLRTTDASYSCCPWPEAVSCADGHHCCPHGSHCSADGRSCFQNQGSFPPAVVDAVQCPDKETQCPNDSTCCQMLDDSWGCCPIPQATCCTDKIHCCPHATTCDVAHSRCLSASGEEPLRTKFPGTKRASMLALARKNICPNNESACPDTATCCLLPTGKYGCCPLQNAVCCEDHVHCCPQGTTCDLEHSKCNLTPRRLWPIAHLLVDLQKAHDVQCDAQHRCPDGNTCCRRPLGDWGCCPLVEAVCCSDGIHCCPKGYTCDLATGSCQQGTTSIPWLAKSSASAVATSAGSVVPCDSHTACPDGQTCCRLPTGTWACCPLVEAVCCSDGVHCCPKGYTCDLATGSCDQGTTSIPWLAKSSASAVATSAGSVVPCDPHTACPDGQTCCRLPTGAWGCCPLVEAVCCPDHLHCCPSGYQCGPVGGTCLKDGESIPWLEKRPAIAHNTASSRDVRCDDQVSCPDGQTCCRLSTGAWGCCPFPEAVCCPDHLHCCPSGYRCGPVGGTCVKDGESIPWLEKRPAIARGPLSSGDVRCDDQASCPDGKTCCRTQVGGWACCPHPQAVCCSDHQHCCPNGYTCDVARGTCLKSQPTQPWGPQRPARPLQDQDVRCNRTASCEEGQTCCKNGEGAWSCCQLPNAVCCEDHQHCCPSGYTCNLKAQACEKQSRQPLTAEGEQPSAPLSPPRATTSGRDVPCDARRYCHDGQTCCPSSSGGWACCPYAKGSCCRDKRHCCPSGFRCSSTGWECLRKGPLRWDTRAFSSQSAEVQPWL